jgi:Ser/Thr protein kinase RdoA (MazF antagonist)
MSKRLPLRIIRSLIASETMVGVVLDNYDLPAPLTCQILNIGDNDNYLILAGGERYVLRLYVCEKHWGCDSDDYCFELELLIFLHSRDVPVSYPLLLRNGSLYGTLDAPEGPRNFALFTFAPGKVDESLEDPRTAFRLGQAIARLHRAADDFKTQYRRFHIGLEFLIERPLARLRNHLDEVGRSRDIAFLESLAEEVTGNIRALGFASPQYGIIGGDIHRSNYHVGQAGEIIFFDFDLCGYGWRAYDLSIFLWDVRLHFDEEKALCLREQLLDGYSSVRRLKRAELRSLNSFMKARYLWLMGEHVADIHTLGVGRLGDAYWDSNISLLRQWHTEESLW